MNPMISTSRTLMFLALSTAIGSAAGGMPPVADDGLFTRLDSDGNGVVTADEVAEEHRRLFDRLLRTADENADQALSLEEMAAALEPSGTEKPIVEKLSSSVPGADSLRWLLLSMDTIADSRIVAAEVPAQLMPAWERLTEQADGNNNGTVERNELSRAGPRLVKIANQTAQQLGIDVATELGQLQESQGEAADRFDRSPRVGEMFGDPTQARALFNLLDQDGNAYLEESEVPDPFRPRFEQLLRNGDRNRDGRISRFEFIKATERAAQFRNQNMPAQ